MSIRRAAVRPIVAMLAGLLVLTACQTGKRPSFVDDPFPKGATTGDAAIDDVLEKLDSVSVESFTTTYELITKFGNATRPAAVSVAPGRRSVTMGTVRYLTTNVGTTTCVFGDTAQCVAGLELARVSDTSLTPDFYAADAAKRLRRDALSTVAPTVARTETIADQPASCIDLTVAGGKIVYCVLDSGVIAKLDDADVLVTLTSAAPTVDESLFSTTEL
jgi:hypothetical protein